MNTSKTRIKTLTRVPMKYSEIRKKCVPAGRKQLFYRLFNEYA